jgi:excinuclease ABC subunit A
MHEFIEVKGAKTHNLKNIDVKIPKDKLVVMTGLSGSGKSSLAFDTIYAEGQRKYVESLSAYARQFLGLMDKPDVEMITGLSPAISIDQKSSGHNPRSTVGTITEIYDYLRLLFARCGHPRSPSSGRRLERQTIQQIVDSVMNLSKINEEMDSLKLMILAPVVKNRKGTYEELFTRFLAQGYVRARVDGHIFNLEEEIKLDKFKKHNIEVVLDRLVLKKDSVDDKEFLKRITDSIELALTLGEQEVVITINPQSVLDTKLLKKINAEVSETDKKEIWYDIFFSEKYVDPESGESFPEVEPHTFSFNSPHGACPRCNGLGFIKEIDIDKLFNPNLSITEGGIYPWSKLADDPDSWSMKQLMAVAQAEGFDARQPLGKLDQSQLKIIMYGSGNKKYTFQYVRKQDGIESKYSRPFEGVIPNLKRRYAETDSDYIRVEIEKYMVEKICDDCKGLRLNKRALAVTINGSNISDVTEMSIKTAKNWMQHIQNFDKNFKNDNLSSIKEYLGIDAIDAQEDKLSKQELEIGKQIFREIENRLNFLLAVGLEYLTLNRTAKTLSGGESQRIRLASQIGTGLTGVLYVLDEPSIGLHQRDNARLLDTLKNLRDIGNTVIVVEHDEDTIRDADFIIDIGPGAGEHGGEVVATGTAGEIAKNKNSITGKYISGERKINRTEIKKEVKKLIENSTNHTISEEKHTDKYLELLGAKQNNLKNVDLTVPLGKFVCITGVSGSGKSSIINETLYPILATRLNRAKMTAGSFDKINGIEHLDKIVNIDQSPIGRTPRSNPATYTGVFNLIRDLFAGTNEARIRGYKPGRFSFNVKGGRCEACKGDGLIKIEMQFLPDVYVTCDVCNGKRYNREALQIDFKGKNIAEVLEMTVEEGVVFFENITGIYNKLKTLNDVGLSYIRLGQAATTLSGGEAQRVKLATELSKRSTGKTIYILDEPTTGLHFEDVRKLLIVLHSLVEVGNTVLVIEHNLDVIKTADWIVDIGPEGGENGGRIIAEGTPLDIAEVKGSYTGEWLKKIL